MKFSNILWSALKAIFAPNEEAKTYRERRVKFENNGRSGYVIFTEGYKSIRLYTEIGGGNCIFYVVIPSRDEWEKQTEYSLDERDEILKFIADECLKQQTSKAKAFYEVEEKHIVFYKK
ncbi:MAG: hypothetical protein IPI59_12210 [Sphingobacteriales bacterium]|jgi:hypothetical protein|nr:hypothetical protein [Sphingobacteriales bacterium]MBP9141518.1 hypothetical protein [Chitinophagales bacterium]MDA0199364.1 hypothetical protein [Bacteroidota bacterium]MBK6889203.1 hypothetical protein [Sphingobacteriales bacterium]MBK7528291.1 hypothetical protein [Sphingobacteriales bacterium]